MSQAVHIVAVAARTPVGLSAETSAAAVRAGVSRLVLHPFLADQTNENLRGAIDGKLDAGILGSERIALLAGAALAALRVQAGALPQPWSVTLALPEARPGFAATDERAVLAALNLEGAEQGVRCAAGARGHAGGLVELAHAAAQLARGRDGLMVLGGADSYFDYDTIQWLDARGRLSTRASRGGLVPGEAAGFVVLASESTRRRLKLPSLAQVVGWGTADEPNTVDGDAVCLGQGLSAAVRQATAALRLPDEAADDLYCDLNGERYRSEEWSLAVLTAGRALRHADYVAPIDCWGDVGAATGPLLCTLAVRAFARGYARGPRALLWAGSDAGARAAVLLAAPGGG